MKSTQELPNDYCLVGAIDLIRDRSLLIKMNLAGIILFFLTGWLLNQYVAYVRINDIDDFNIRFAFDLKNLFYSFIILMIVIFIMVILHEGLHGVFFWAFTRSRPKFALKGFYAYAAAPDWYIPKNAYMIVALAPFLMISFMGIYLISFIPVSIVFPMIVLLTLNASGSVGDLWVFFWLLFKPGQYYLLDQGDKIKLFETSPK